MPKFDQTSFFKLRNNINKINDNLFVLYGLVHLGECDLLDCNRNIKHSLKQTQSILDDFEKTQFPYIGK